MLSWRLAHIFNTILVVLRVAGLRRDVESTNDGMFFKVEEGRVGYFLLVRNMMQF